MMAINNLVGHGSSTQVKKLNLFIDTNVYNPDIAKMLSDLNVNIDKQVLDLIITVKSNIIVGSTSTSVPAFILPKFTEDSVITLINYGWIVGKGGDGGGSTEGFVGGTGLELRHPVSIDNKKTIGGGGGGGGAGQTYDSPGYGFSGGGGAGSEPGQTNTPSGGSKHYGSPGTLEKGGQGGAGAGGDGGDLGKPGGGAHCRGKHGQWNKGGGAAGKAIIGARYAVFINTGIIAGDVVS